MDKEKHARLLEQVGQEKQVFQISTICFSRHLENNRGHFETPNRLLHFHFFHLLSISASAGLASL